ERTPRPRVLRGTLRRLRRPLELRDQRLRAGEVPPHPRGHGKPAFPSRARGRGLHRCLHADARGPVRRAGRRRRLGEGRGGGQAAPREARAREGGAPDPSRGNARGAVRPDRGLGGSLLLPARRDAPDARRLRDRPCAGRRPPRRPLAPRDADLPDAGGRGARAARRQHEPLPDGIRPRARLPPRPLRGPPV
ncbi:MAG: Methyltransferase type 12, partial [uncultured Rubrobacteraceae bacterium]